jgi:hypothetical protein
MHIATGQRPIDWQIKKVAILGMFACRRHNRRRVARWEFGISRWQL